MTTRTGPDPKELADRLHELEAELSREKRTSTALREVGIALGTTLDLDELLELILRKMTELLEADRTVLFLLDEAKGELVSRLGSGETSRMLRASIDHGIAGMVARTGNTIRVRDAYRDERFSPSVDELPDYRTRSVLAAPLKNHVGKVLGVVLVLNKKGGRAFTAADEGVLAALATQAAISIDNSRLFLSVLQKNMQLLDIKDKLEHRLRDLKLLFDLESTMGRATSERELFHGALREAALACNARAAAILVATPSGDGVDRYLWEREHPERILHEPHASSGGILEQTMRTNRPARLGPGPSTSARPAAGSSYPEGATAAGATAPPPSAAGATAPPPSAAPPSGEASAFADEAGTAPFNPRDGQTPRSLAAVPLEGEDEAPLGALALYDKLQAGAFTDDDVSLLRLIAANVSTAVRLFRARVAREREERLSTIGQLLSGVVHDLKTPMAVISGYVQMMASAAEAGEREHYAELVLAQLGLLTAMQREVLEFARGERKIFVRKVYLGKFFSDLVEQLRRGLDTNQVELTLELDDKGTAKFDEAKITRALHNLVRNAVEAMGERGGKITVAVKRAPPSRAGEPGDLLVAVRDTGPGIPKEIEGQLFQSFVSSGKRGGTGLGLAIVKKIAEEHGGTVEVESSSGKTTFTLVLPQGEGTA